MDDQEISIIYPTFQITETGIQPYISLPRNYRDRLPQFWDQKREENVEEYLEQLKQGNVNNPRFPDILLQWEMEQGLTNIAIGMEGGLDLEDSFEQPSFRTHNLGGPEGLYGATVAMFYVNELLKCSP